MKIVIDTNIFCRDYFMRGAEFKVFLDGLGLLPGFLEIPEVVVDETTNRYREELIDAIAADQKLRRTLNRLQIRGTALATDPEKEAAAFRQTLEGWIIQHGGETIPYPNLPHKTLVDRDLSRRKPFKRDGSGYRDSLIWENIKHLLILGTELVVFVTDNYRDFGRGSSVDPELQSEVFNPGNLTIVGSLREFNEIFITPRLPMLKELATSLEGDSSAIDLLSWLQRNLLDAMRREEWGSWVLGLPDSNISVWPSDLLRFVKVTIAKVNQLTSGEKLITIEVVAEVDFSVDVEPDDCFDDPSLFNLVGSWHQSAMSKVQSRIIPILYSLHEDFDFECRRH